MHNIKLDIRECNLDKDILATIPTIQTKGLNIHRFDDEGKLIHTIPTTRLQWLWTQYNT
jgi:hypothetical protein